MRGAAFGRRGERAAERHLREKGYRILARNWACRTGEIDLVAMDGDEVVFVEVKTRTGAGRGGPEEAVGRAKRDRLRSAAATFMSGRPEEEPYRIDVAAVEPGPDGVLMVRHLVAAVGEDD